MKIAFYFRTTKEYSDIQALISEVNKKVTAKGGWSERMNTLHVATKYEKSSFAGQARQQTVKIPKTKPTKKKYLGVIRGNKHVLDKVEIDLFAILEKNSVELAPTEDGPRKYDGEQSTAEFYLTGLTQFRTLVSVFDKRFGQSNWRVNGPKYLQKVLKNYELASEQSNNPNNIFTIINAPDHFKDKYPDGVKVTIIVNEPNANIEKHLFKVKLKV